MTGTLNTVRLVLMILAIVALLLHASGWQSLRGNLQSLGLALWALATIIG